MLKRVIVTLGVLLVAAGSARAETSPYIGLGADHATPHSGEAQSFGTIIAGATFDVWPQAGLGAEVEVGQNIGSGDGRQTVRLRGIATYDFGAVTGVAALGMNHYSIDGDGFSGQTVGLGVQAQIRPNMTGRAEFLRDFDDSDFGTDVTTARVAVFFNF